MAIETDPDSRQVAPERQIERYDAMARAARTHGYLYGVGKAKLARALARKRSLGNIRYRRAAQDIVRALDRNRKRVLENIR